MAVIVASIAMLALFALAVGAVAVILYSVMQDRADESRQRIRERLDRL